MTLRFAWLRLAHALAAVFALPCLWLCACSSRDPRPTPELGDAASPGVDAGAVPSMPEAGTNAHDASHLGLEPDSARPDAAPPDAAPSDAAHTVTDAAVDDVAPALTLQLAEGRIRGKLAGDSRIFLGIPYAQAPIGPLRFAPPAPYPAWRDTRSALEFAPSCPQPASGVKGPVSEDCLFLNVTTPHTPPAGGAPVMVFIHGGGFGTGSGSGYPAQWLSGPTETVIVTLNYRLGTLGFLVHPALDALHGVPSGNLGLRDQQLALAWVRRNIAAFGGDPHKVTVFGESAGALSTCIHMVAHGSEGLADAFIMESGACVAGSLAPRTRERVQRAGIAYADDVCPFTTDMVGCLRGLSADKLVPADFVTAAGGQADVAWPYVDGNLLPEHPMALVRAGKLSHGPAIVGSNAREAALYPLYGFPTANNKLDLLTTLIGLYPDDWQAIYAHYEPADDAGANEALIRAQTDEQFRCPSRALARALTAQGSQVYLYSFEVYPAAHSMELDYVFGWPSGGPSEQFPKEAPIPPTPSVVQAVQSYWTTFARSSDPNGGSLPTWPSYRLAEDAHMVLAQPLSVGHALARDDCDFWDTVYARAE